MAREIWDAYDRNGNKLGFDLYRDQTDKIPPDVYHIVVNIFTLTKDDMILVTQRSPEKPISPLKWEITGGSIIKGETAAQGAVRELAEETGICADKKQMRLLKVIADGYDLWHYFLLKLPQNHDEISITLQPRETSDYKFISLDEFKELFLSHSFVSHVRKHLEKEILNDMLLSNK